MTTKVELQVVADVAIVGFEKSGKSTLLHHLISPINLQVERTRGM